MEFSPVQAPRSSIEEDGWDTDGFVIRSLGIDDADSNKTGTPEADKSKVSMIKAKDEKDTHHGPHGPPPTQPKEQVHNLSSRKQRFKLKLKEANKRDTRSGHESKVDNLRELLGGNEAPMISSKDVSPSPGEWLDPHCHESEFEKISES